MSLSMLVNGADCGPANPLQGLSKQFDRDRGLQQDHFGVGRAGPSKEGFRTQYSSAPGADQDAARFFSADQTSVPPRSDHSTYDLTSLHTSLPFAYAETPVQSPSIMSPAPAAWAADFLQQTPVHNPLKEAFFNGEQHSQQRGNNQIHSSLAGVSQQGSVAWQPSVLGFPNRMASMPMQAYPMLDPGQQASTEVDASQWDEAFQSHEGLLHSEAAVSDPMQETSRPLNDADELARAAASVMDAVQYERNPKFQNSQFLGLMKQLRDREMVVEGDTMVPVEEASSTSGGWATEFQKSATDVKGKGRALEPLRMTVNESGIYSIGAQNRPTEFDLSGRSEVFGPAEEEIDAYFRTDNDDYINYWRGPESQGARFQSSTTPPAVLAEWDKLQRDWDIFEATTTGIKPISNYQFQANNPYVLGEASRHHNMHSTLSAASLELQSVLELEAAVQRDPYNATAWFSLGVKQQENEREQKALHALRRALELDSTHLPAWLALAISHTNDGNRRGSYEAIRSWVQHNVRYREAVEAYRASHGDMEDFNMAQTGNSDSLVECLIAMARSDISGEIDADIQIALAILMNTNEAYDKARDCFTTALAVRPDDWQLYNRVGATLANNGQSQDALQYYYHALELNPAYIRARFNLGISCINLRRYQEASQHILDALVLQDADVVQDPAEDGTENKRGVVSSALWESLKTCCMQMQRIDLATICDRQDLDAFRLNYQIL